VASRAEPAQRPAGPEPVRPGGPEADDPARDAARGPDGAARGPGGDDAVYGPDDPGYGPPDPAWYAQRLDEQREEREAEARRAAAAAELRSARGPFEPPPEQSPFRDRDPAPARAWPGAGPGEEGASASPEDALGRLRDMYLTAEAVQEDVLERHYGELLRRQRQLIRQYLAGTEPARRGEKGQGEEDRAGTAPGEAAAPAAGPAVTAAGSAAGDAVASVAARP
jgi:hypothetical protein